MRIIHDNFLYDVQSPVVGEFHINIEKDSDCSNSFGLTGMKLLTLIATSLDRKRHKLSSLKGLHLGLTPQLLLTCLEGRSDHAHRMHCPKWTSDRCYNSNNIDKRALPH